jgi:hypothetical protein
VSFFGDIGHAFGGAAKGVSSAVSVVTKPVGKAIKPVTNLVRDGVVKVTAGTPIGGLVQSVSRFDFGKDPLGAAGKAVVANYSSAANFAKGMVASKIGGAVQGAVGEAVKGTALEGQGVETAFGESATNLTNAALGTKSGAGSSPATSASGRPATVGGQRLAVDTQRGIQVRSSNPNVGVPVYAPSALRSVIPADVLERANALRAGSLAGAASAAAVADVTSDDTSSPADKSLWAMWAGRKEHMGGVIHDGVL